MSSNNGWDQTHKPQEYQPKTFMGSLAKSLGFNIEHPRVSLTAELGRLYQEAYYCETEEQRLENINQQELVKAALRNLAR